MIYTPRCPVFRRDSGELLPEPYYVDFITSPAPNAGVIRRNDPERVEEIPEVLMTRSAKLLGLGVSFRIAESDEPLFASVSPSFELDPGQENAYRQNFEGFIPGMSVLDILFNHGPEAVRLLQP